MLHAYCNKCPCTAAAPPQTACFALIVVPLQSGRHAGEGSRVASIKEAVATLCRYVDIHTDPEWRGLLGGKRRVLMAKGAAVFSGTARLTSISTNLLQRLEDMSARLEV